MLGIESGARVGRRGGLALLWVCSCSEALGVLSCRDLVSGLRTPSCGHFLHHPKSLRQRCWDLGVSGVQSCVVSWYILREEARAACSILLPTLPPGVLYSEWQDHREEGCCCAPWRLLPHHRHAELWRESQSGPAPLEWLGTFLTHQPLLSLLPLYRTRYPVPDFPEDFFT